MLPRHGEDPISVELERTPDNAELKDDTELIMRAIDLLGVEAALSESDLHKRFPVPRFWHHRGSESVIVEEANLDPCIDYMCLELPLPSSTPLEGLGSKDFDEPPPKRSKTSNDPETASYLKLYIPHFQYDLYGLADIAQDLKDSARRSEVVVGFVISLLGGVLHLSYPPTLDELKLYCEVILLHEHYGIRMGDFLYTLANVLEGLRLPQPVPIPPQKQVIIDLAAFVWVMCSQSRTCLALLAPHLSTQRAATQLLERIAPMVSLNSARFIELVMWSVNKDPWKLPYNGPWGLIPEIYPYHFNPSWDNVNKDFRDGDMKKLCDKIYAVDSTFHDQIDENGLPPSHLFFISSSLPCTKSTMRLLVYKSLLVDRWPYFKALIESGLTEAKTRSAELPFSDITIKHLLIALYHDERFELPPKVSLELIERGPQFGLFDSLHSDNEHIRPTNALPAFERLISQAAHSTFHRATAFALNLAHSFGLHEWWRMRLEGLSRQHFGLRSPDLHPDITAVAEALIQSNPRIRTFL